MWDSYRRQLSRFQARQRRERPLNSKSAILIATLIAVQWALPPSARATKFWKNGAVTGAWSTGNNWSAFSAAGGDNGGAPAQSEAVNIVNTDGTARTVTYDVDAPALGYGLLSIDLIGAGATTNTLSMPNNNSLNAAAIFVGGYSGSGTTAGRGVLNQSAGTTTILSGTDLVVGHGTGSTGTYALSGGALVANQSEYVGLSGSGTFTQSAGTNTINASLVGSMDIGINPTASGTYNLSGTATLTSNASEYVGDQGVGSFIQTGGSNSISGTGKSLYIGYSPGGVGSYTLGSGSLQVSGGSEYVGHGASGSPIGGTFTQTGGTNTVGGGFGLHIGYSGGVTGVYNQSGGTTNVGEFYVGTGAGSIGKYTLSNGSLSTTSGNQYIAYSGTGQIDQSGGTASSASDLDIGLISSASGTYNLTGGSNTISGSVYVAGYSGGSGGSGVLNVSGTGALSMGGTLVVYNQPSTSVNLSSGGLIVAHALDFNGNPSLFHWTGGTLELTTNVQWFSGAGALATSRAFGSALTLGNSQVLKVDNNEDLGGNSGFSLTLNSGSANTVGGNLIVNQASSLNVNGTAQTTMGGTLTIANNIGATVNFAGGNMSAAGLNFNDNPSRFNWTSGALTINNSVQWNIGPGSTGTSRAFGSALTLGSTQSLAVTGNEDLGGNAGFALTVNSGSSHTVGGILTVNLSSALNVNASSQATVGTLAIANNTGAAVNLNGGTINAGALNFNDNPAHFNWTTGTLNLTNDVVWNASPGQMNTTSKAFGPALALGSAQTLKVTGNETLGGEASFSMTLNNESTHTVSGTLSITSNSSLTLSGGSLSAGSIANNGNFTINSGAITVGDVTLNSTSALHLGLGGISRGLQYGALTANGNVALSGSLIVSLNSFTPAYGQTFDLIDWSARSGTFNSVSLPALTGSLVWNTSGLYTSGAISVGLAGDYNGNGIVDAADYTVWRDALGTTSDLLADGNGNGLIDSGDYNVWKANFDAHSGSGAGQLNSVPEPTSLVILLIGMSAMCTCRRAAAPQPRSC
jgi:hypothetical protein